MRFRIKACLLANALALSLFCYATAGPLDDARAAFNRHDYEAELRIVRPMAEHGNAQAQYELGAAYALGHGVPLNLSNAAIWYQKAAEQGIARAQSNLGTMYASGIGVPADPARAITWLGKAAAQGDPMAYESLGAIYLYGNGVAKDYPQSYRWSSLAVPGLSDFPLSRAIEGCDAAAAKMTPAQIDDAKSQAKLWAAQHPTLSGPPLF